MYDQSELIDDVGCEIFWDKLNDVLNNMCRGFLLIIWEDLIGCIGDRKRDGAKEAFGVVRENENGRKVIDFSVNRDVFVCYTWTTRVNIIIRELV